MSKATIIV